MKIQLNENFDLEIIITAKLYCGQRYYDKFQIIFTNKLKNYQIVYSTEYKEDPYIKWLHCKNLCKIIENKLLEKYNEFQKSANLDDDETLIHRQFEFVKIIWEIIDNY